MPRKQNVPYSILSIDLPARLWMLCRFRNTDDTETFPHTMSDENCKWHMGVKKACFMVKPWWLARVVHSGKGPVQHALRSDNLQQHIFSMYIISERLRGTANCVGHRSWFRPVLEESNICSSGLQLFGQSLIRHYKFQGATVLCWYGSFKTAKLRGLPILVLFPEG